MITFILLITFVLWKLSFILLSLILLYSKIPSYLYPFFGTSLILSPSGISSSSDGTTFLLFDARTPQSCILNSIPTSFLDICTVEANPFTSHLLFAKFFKSSIKKRLFNFSPLFKVYPDFTFLNIWVRSIIQSTNSNGDKLPPENMALLMSMYARYSPYYVKSVLYSFIAFALIQGFPKSRNGVSYHKFFYNQSMRFQD